MALPFFSNLRSGNVSKLTYFILFALHVYFIIFLCKVLYADFIKEYTIKINSTCYKESQDIFCYDSKVGYWHGLSQNYENRPESFKTFLTLIGMIVMMVIIRNGYVKKCHQNTYTQSAEVDES